MWRGHLEAAERVRALVRTGASSPAVFRAELARVPRMERDAWLDEVLGLGAPPDDGPELPRGGVPYLPCPVDAVMATLAHAEVGPGDVFVDIGAGVGRAVALAHLATGAEAIGVEIQEALVGVARGWTSALNLTAVSVVHADAAVVTGPVCRGSVFFLYCPFSDDRLVRFVDALEPIARARQIRLGCVDVSLPPRPWLTHAVQPSENVAVYVSR